MQPITYYIDRTVPVEWRPFVRAGILEWNRAFEDAGFRDAIRVLDAPDDSAWSAADARYSTVRWTANNGAVYAVGPTNVDPRTGEILNADILISAAWIQRWRGQSGQYVAPVAAVQSVLQDDSLAQAGGRRVAALPLWRGDDAQSGALATAVMAARGEIPAGGEASRAYVGQALKALVMHEVGHTLGLRHNFRGSAGANAAQLANRSWTASHGLGVSVMDYSPPALALDPGAAGRLLRPDHRQLRSLGDHLRLRGRRDRRAPRSAAKGGGPDGRRRGPPTSRSTGSGPSPPRRPTRRTCTAPTRTPGSAASASIPPSAATIRPTTRWAGRAAVSRSSTGCSTRSRPGSWRPGRATAGFGPPSPTCSNDRWYALLVTTKYLGGATTSRDHRGDPGARPAVVNVPAGAAARGARRSWRRRASASAPIAFRPRCSAGSRRIAGCTGAPRPERTGASISRCTTGRMTQQGSLLGQLLDPMVLARIRDAELRAAAGRGRRWGCPSCSPR